MLGCCKGGVHRRPCRQRQLQLLFTMRRVLAARYANQIAILFFNHLFWWMIFSLACPSISLHNWISDDFFGLTTNEMKSLHWILQWNKSTIHDRPGWKLLGYSVKSTLILGSFVLSLIWYVFNLLASHSNLWPLVPDNHYIISHLQPASLSANNSGSYKVPLVFLWKRLDPFRIISHQPSNASHKSIIRISTWITPYRLLHNSTTWILLFINLLLENCTSIHL